MYQRLHTSVRIIIASLVLSTGLVLVGWFDYTSTRSELLTLLVDQAASLRQAVAAAARAGEAATAQTQATLTARLLDNARLLKTLDARGGLSQAVLDEVARANSLFRITVFSASGARTLTSGPTPAPWAGRGFGPGPGRGGGGAGGGGGIGALTERLLRGDEPEAVSELHGARWDQGWRLSAGVRRSNGGAVCSTLMPAPWRSCHGKHRSSISWKRLRQVTGDCVRGARDGTSQLAYGALATPATATPAPARQPFGAVQIPAVLAGLDASELMMNGVPVLEFSGPVDAGRAR
jgi:hypothetical protein